MARIYVSSTYDDLIEQRQVAAESVRRLGHHPIAMEDYVASDARPLQRCIEDVRTCDALISIIAWRYGFVPPDKDKSITHLEFLAATEANIPRLVFLLKEDAPWPKTLIDSDLQQIEKFRQSLLQDRLVSFFSDSSQLRSQVTESLASLALNRVNSALRSLKVFLTETGDTRHIARALAERLRDEGVDVWLDIDQLGPGDWISPIEDALDNSDVLVAFLSHSSVQSIWAMIELRHFVTKRMLTPDGSIGLLVVRCDDVPVPVLLSDFPVVDISQGAGIEDVIKVLNEMATQLNRNNNA